MYEVKSGDIVICLGDRFKPFHVGVIGADPNGMIHSVHSGVKQAYPPNGNSVIYRYTGPFKENIHPGFRAAQIVTKWGENGSVGYSSAGVRDTKWRAVGAWMGGCGYGKGAIARLDTYRKRLDGMAPKNVICSEMAILGYQLAGGEDDKFFIKLDGKHTLPYHEDRTLRKDHRCRYVLALVEVHLASLHITAVTAPDNTIDR